MSGVKDKMLMDQMFYLGRTLAVVLERKSSTEV